MLLRHGMKIRYADGSRIYTVRLADNIPESIRNFDRTEVELCWGNDNSLIRNKWDVESDLESGEMVETED